MDVQDCSRVLSKTARAEPIQEGSALKESLPQRRLVHARPIEPMFPCP